MLSHKAQLVEVFVWVCTELESKSVAGFLIFDTLSSLNMLYLILYVVEKYIKPNLRHIKKLIKIYRNSLKDSVNIC